LILHFLNIAIKIAIVIAFRITIFVEIDYLDEKYYCRITMAWIGT
jgi:hypothetical protein